MAKTILKITQIRSLIGSQQKKHRVVMESLGFRRNQQTLYKNDTPQIRGMMQKVRHLVAWEEIDEKSVPKPADKSPGFTIVSGKAAGAKKTKKKAKKKAKSKAKKSPKAKSKAKKSSGKKAE